MTFPSWWLALLVHGALALVVVGIVTLAVLWIADARGRRLW